VVSPMRKGVGRNRRVLYGGRRIPGLQRPATGGLNLRSRRLAGWIEMSRCRFIEAWRSSNGWDELEVTLIGGLWG
jgi:hypothetical protein